jgi:hypothetical protein
MLFLGHGLIHLLGFAKAFHFTKIEQLTKDISKPLGVLWLMTGMLFIISSALQLLKKDYWPFLTIVAVVLSQVLIFIFWKDAKFGTLANIIIFLVATVSWAGHSFQNTYKKDIVASFDSATDAFEVINEKDLEHLPEPVQNYLNYVGVVGKPKVNNFRIVFEGEMRDKGKDWFAFTSEQYNFIESPTRLFFMKAKVSGLPTYGYHKYMSQGASMLIKLLSLLPVAKIDNPKMFPTETVTFFNDLCLFAPAALIDKRIEWRTIDDLSAEAAFTTNGTTISAMLQFNKEGQLINFISNDRYAVSDMKRFPFSTPVRDYKEVNGYRLPTIGEAVWHYPDGEFVYGKFHLKSIEYNVAHLKEE